MAFCSGQVANCTDFSQSFPGMAFPSGDTGLSSKGGQAAGPETTGSMKEPGRVVGCAGSVAISEASLKGIFVVPKAN